MGRVLARQLTANDLPFVIVDNDEGKIERCRKVGWFSMCGDATDDAILKEAGTESARGLASVLPHDADNVYVVLTARLLAPDIQIIARASDKRVVAKLERAGANRVVSLYTTAAAKMAHFLIHPHVERVLEVISAEGSEMDLAEIEVTEGSPFTGEALTETDFNRRGIIIVGIRRPDGSLLFPPPNSIVLESGDHLIAMGKSEVVEELSRNA